MTNTPHGQVPEALRLADALERPGYGWHTTPAQCAAVLRRLHAENEALRTQQPAPDGAPPGAYVNGAGIKADDRPSTVIRKLNARFHDLVTFPRAEKFAASPTPPAEQTFITPETGNSASAKGAAITSESGTPPAEQQASATEVALVGAYARLPDFDSGDEPIWEAVFKWKAANPGSDASKKAMAVEGAIIKSLRDFADRTHALRKQAANKAAPVEPSEHQIRAITTAYEQGVGKGHQAYKSGKEIANPYDSTYRCDLAWQYGYGEGKEQAQRGVKPDRQCLALYTAPQPTPAPVSEREAFEAWIEKDGGDLGTFGTPPNMHYRNSSVNNAWVAWKARAALAAQGGKCPMRIEP